MKVDETLGQLLVSEGMQNIEEISQSVPDDITKIEGIDEATANELINRSKENLIKEKKEISKRLKELGMEDSLANLKGITQGMLVLLGQRNIKTLGDFADLSSDELIGGFDEVKGKTIGSDQNAVGEWAVAKKIDDAGTNSSQDLVQKDLLMD